MAEPASSINDHRKGEEVDEENINRHQQKERKIVRTSSPSHFLKDYNDKTTQMVKSRDQHSDQEENRTPTKKIMSSHNSKGNSNSEISVEDVRDEYNDKKGITTRSKASSPSYHLKDNKIKKATAQKVGGQHDEQRGIVNLTKMTVIVSPINYKSKVMEIRDEHSDLKRVKTGSKMTKVTSPQSKRRHGEDFGDQHRYLNKIMTRSKVNSPSYDSKNISIKETPPGETIQLSQQRISVKRGNRRRETVCKKEATKNNKGELGSSSQEYIEKTNRRVTRSVTINERSRAGVPKISSASGRFTTSMSGG